MGDHPSMACCMGLCFVAPKTDSKRFHLQRTDVSNHKPKSVTSHFLSTGGPSRHRGGDLQRRFRHHRQCELQGRETRTLMPGMGDGHDVDKMISKSPHLVKVEAATWKIANCQGITFTASKWSSLWQALWQRTHRRLCETLRSPQVGVQLGWRRRCPFWVFENIQISNRNYDYDEPCGFLLNLFQGYGESHQPMDHPSATPPGTSSIQERWGPGPKEGGRLRCGKKTSKTPPFCTKKQISNPRCITFIAYCTKSMWIFVATVVSLRILQLILTVIKHQTVQTVCTSPGKICFFPRVVGWPF